MITPFFYLLSGLAAQGSDFWASPENVVIAALIGGGVSVYAISKIDTLKSMFGYFLVLLVVCIIAMVLPIFRGTGVEQYAEQTLTLLNELLRSLIKWVNSQTSGVAFLSKIIGGGIL